ncbi:MAG: hypothetical protein JNM10_12500 [Planctomycetia bacterium]|nr:hypothetical protein [Planctomycetia bacterium]
MTVAPALPRSSRGRRTPIVLLALGGATFAAGLFRAPAAVWPAYLASVFALTTVGLGAAVFVALHHVTGARWGRAVLPVAHAVTTVLPWAGLAHLVLPFGVATLHPWADPAAVAADHALSGRAGWMTVPWVIGRTAVAFGAWVLLARVLVARSRATTTDSPAGARSAAARAGVRFLLAFAPTFSVYGFDWVLSLERTFASTMFAVYHFSGLFLGAVALVTILAIRRRRSGRLAPDPAWSETLHDLGKLVFAFAFFWGYIWYCQYMLIWYTNLPEETPHYVIRHRGAWEPVAVLNVVLQWLVPFVILMPRAMKRNETVLLRVCAVVLVGRVADLALAVLAPVHGAALPGLAWELGVSLGGVGAFLVLWRRATDGSDEPPTTDVVARAQA